ncbi:hypothetical protein FRACA_320004 [Frankia canadensis]|uniref:WYL domain-containing protein n=1 Tax=Frankia canadensis TaxID=1836972 RepID=A0A2I2KUG1_9ACTN|nr:hypothetical protein FRACA_320004 [Frankia canadensis]SOU56595.1 hypothetical protein FRACA_320004 [Frankia canadensis]
MADPSARMLRLLSPLLDDEEAVALGGRWYLLAFDADRDDWRTFRVGRAGRPHGRRMGHRRGGRRRIVPAADGGGFARLGGDVAHPRRRTVPCPRSAAAHRGDRRAGRVVHPGRRRGSSAGLVWHAGRRGRAGGRSA